LLPATAALTAIAVLAFVPLARLIGLVDHPGVRKVHETVTPLAGGPAVFVVLVLIVALTLPDNRFMQALGAGGLIMLITGMVDDRRHLSAMFRFLVQIGACSVMIWWGGVYLQDFGQLMSSNVFDLNGVAIPITVFAALGVINSFNMIDGMDGLAGTIFLVAAAGMALFAHLAGQGELLWLLLISMAAVTGFLFLNARFPWNPKARVFLGDAGSLLLGFILAWCLISLGGGVEVSEHVNDEGLIGNRAFMPMTAVWLIAVPLLDTSTLMWRRWRSGQSAFAADQYHLHHAFLRAGYSVGETWLGITLLTLLLAGIGVALEFSGFPGYVSFYVFMAVALTYYFYIRHCWITQRMLGRDFVYNDFQVQETYD